MTRTEELMRLAEAGWDAAIKWMSFHAIAKMLEEKNDEKCKKV